jgi:hypothetical protein
MQNHEKVRISTIHEAKKEKKNQRKRKLSDKRKKSSRIQKMLTIRNLRKSMG